ncbi:hypothetical protein VAA_02197 [Vibrio anguillarum 775]|nr:hypothetical protein VAA_02197 [Vibrio anguillarum 775]
MLFAHWNILFYWPVTSLKRLALIHFGLFMVLDY